MPKVILKGYILVADTDLAAVKEELLNHIRLTRQEEGCLAFDVSQDTENSNRFNIYEEFTDRISFESHQKRVRNSRWGEVSENVSRYYQVNEGD